MIVKKPRIIGTIFAIILAIIIAIILELDTVYKIIIVVILGIIAILIFIFDIIKTKIREFRKCRKIKRNVIQYIEAIKNGKEPAIEIGYLGYVSKHRNKKFKKIKDLNTFFDYCIKTGKLHDKVIEKEIESKKKEPIELENKKSNYMSLKSISAIVVTIAAIVVIFSQVLPAFADVDIKFGKEIEILEDDTGIWKIGIYDGFISNIFKVENKKIILRVTFGNDVTIDEKNIVCNPSPNKKNIDDHNKKEYVWDTLQGGIYVQFKLNSSSELNNDTWFNVEVRTSTGVKYRYYG